MGSCGFMGPKVMQACAKVLPRLLSTATGRGRSGRGGRSGQLGRAGVGRFLCRCPAKVKPPPLDDVRWRKFIRCPRLTRHATGAGIATRLLILNQADGEASFTLIFPFHLYLGTPDLKTHRTSCIGASAGPVETDFPLFILIPNITTIIPHPSRGQDDNTCALHCGEVICSI